MKGKYIFIIIGILFFFVLRYLFVVGVIAEEGVAGGLYEPLMVYKIESSYRGSKATIFPSHEFYSSKKIGSVELITLKKNFLGFNYFPSKIKMGDEVYPILFYPYIGALYIYIPKLFVMVFGENVYSIRSLCLVTFILFIVVYLKFVRKFHPDINKAFLITFFLITYPFFGMRFLSFSLWVDTVVFICIVLLLTRIKEILEKSFLTSKDILYLSSLGGLMLHFHLLVSGALFASIIIAFLLTKRFEISFKTLRLLPLIGSLLIFFLFVGAFITIYPLASFLLLKVGNIGIKKIILMPLIPFGFFISFIFLPSFSINLAIQGKFDLIYVPFSGLPGILIFLSILTIIKKIKEEKFIRFAFITIFIYFLFSIVPIYIRPYHFNYIFILIVPFIFVYLERVGISKRMTNIIILLSICFNMIQNEMLRNSIMNSSLSLSIQKDVIKYLEEQGIKEVNDFSGRHGFEFLSKGKIKSLDFYLYLSSRSKERIAQSLMYAKGKVIMVENYKPFGLTTGISPEEVYSVAETIGLRVKILKKFPDDENPVITLMKVE